MSEQYVFYLEQFQSIVCRECQYGITKGGLRRHFERRHNSIPVKQRRDLETYIKQFDLREVKETQDPLNEVNPIEGLKIHEGYMCTVQGCHHLRTTLMSIQKHCQSKHGWTESKGTYQNNKC
jgi:Orsellinic acid/F9775 biosynthesis cluster protein D